MFRQIVKSSSLVLVVGLAMGFCYYAEIEAAETVARGEERILSNTGPYSVPSTPEIEIASISLFSSWLGIWFVHIVTGMSGRILWIPLGACAFIAFSLSLILVALEFGMLPPPTWRLLGIAIVFNATGGVLAISMAKHRW